MDVRGYFDSVRRGDAGRLRELLDAEPALLAARTSPERWPEWPDGCSGLHVAVHADRADTAKVLIEAGVDLEARTGQGRTALHESIELGRGEITRLLRAAGAEVDVCSAAILGDLERLLALLDADPGLANDRSTQLSPLGWAAYGNQLRSAEELLARGARMDDGELLCAASVGHVAVGRLLLERGADPDAIDSRAGGNALHAAVSMKYTNDSRPFVAMLIERGVDLAVRTASGLTAVELARRLAERQHASRVATTERKTYSEVAEMLQDAAAGRGAW